MDLKVVILAGGKGSRLSEETDSKPKPMVEIGDRPILWHIMKYYACFGFREFVVALGYKGESIKRYFVEYEAMNGDLTVDLANGRVVSRRTRGEDWLVHLIDTGLETASGGRVKRLMGLLRERFMLTYGDGVADINLNALLKLHESCGKIATVSAVRPPARFGSLQIRGDIVESFTEKSQAAEGWINGGFFVFEPGIFEYIPGDTASLEAVTLERIAAKGELAVYRHEGFWQPMDTLRDVRRLQSLWESGGAPWKLWK